MKNPSISIQRRRFLQAAGASATALALPSFGAVGANDTIRLGLIGCGGRGTSLAKQFSGLPKCEFVAVSDPDTDQMDKAVKAAKLDSVEKHQDYRKLLDNAEIDAVVIASPNHWHALHMIHACQAGKDVYVEKPVLHQLSESEAIIAAAAKHDRVVQAGTQNRSDTGLMPAVAAIQAGEFGKIKAVRGLCYRNRKSIGKRDTPLTPPASVNYDLWLGPAKDEPIMRPRFHYDWHWLFNTGDGDIGNQAPHELDLISWVLGDPGLPSELQSYGGRFGWNDAGNTANMQAVWFELSGVPVIFEVNNMWLKPELNASPAFKGSRVGVIVTCEGGEFRGGRGGGYVVGPDGKEKIKKFPGDAGAGHAQNFLDAVRSRDSSSLRAKIGNACKSGSLAQLANISLRTGAPASGKALRDGGVKRDDLLEVLDRQEKQLDAWSVDTTKTPFNLGSVVKIDQSSGKVSGPAPAVAMAKATHRKGYQLPSSI